MELESIKLTNFRNHKSLTLSLDSNITLILGPNGSGKTNILEAINVLSTAKSFKAVYDRDTIMHGKDYTRIEGRIKKDSDLINLEMLISANEKFAHTSSKKVTLNGVNRSLHTILGTFNTVLFTPEDIELLTGSPSQRRKYMDLALFQINNGYKKALSEYAKAIKQRNKLLDLINKTGKGRDQLYFWEQIIIEKGSHIQNNRKELFEFMDTSIKKHWNILNDNQNGITILYKINLISKERLESHRETEILAKNTLIGPHRDDFEIFLDSYSLSEFGSRGQQRTAILALKLAEIDFLVHKNNQLPVLLLDDILSELDIKHRNAVMDTASIQQTIMTGIDDTNIQHGKQKLNTIRL